MMESGSLPHTQTGLLGAAQGPVLPADHLAAAQSGADLPTRPQRPWGPTLRPKRTPGHQPMLYNALKLAHVLSLIVWLGGMVFAHFFLRPAVQALEPLQRVRLMHDVLQRFLAAVGVAVLLVLASGLWMIGLLAHQATQAGGHFAMPLDWTTMATLGLVMMAIFGHIRFALLRRLQRAVAASDAPAGGRALASIRSWVAVNLALGLAIVVVTLLV